MASTKLERCNRAYSEASTYDGNGNATTYSATTCTYDPENRLTAYGSALTAGYDGDGLRGWKASGGATTLFLYDGTTPVCELSSSGTVTASNVYGAQGLLARKVSSTTTFYTFDPQGSVSQRVTSSGVASSDCYRAWGAASTTATSADVFGYGAQWGYYSDSETGLILCTHRYYDPAQGRWLTRDPIGYEGGVNLYGYCGEQPVDHEDYDGCFYRIIVPPLCIFLHIVILVIPGCPIPAKVVLEMLVLLLCDTVKPVV